MPQSGKYQGERVTSAGRTEMVAWIGDYTGESDNPSTTLKLYEVRGGDAGVLYKFDFKKSGTLIVTSPTETLQLAVGDDGCARQSTGSLEICWTSASLHIKSSTMDLSLDRWESGALKPRSDTNKIYTLEELTGRARFGNYQVREEAEHVYRAKEQVVVQTGNLLPSLSISSLVGLGLNNTISLFDLAGNLIPFIFPDNWYALEKAKELRDAERYSMAALTANQINGVEGLFYAILRDQEVLSLLDRQISSLQRVEDAIRSREEAGRLSPGTAAYFATNKARLELDQSALRNHVALEYSLLAEAVNLPPRDGIVGLQAGQMPDLAQVPQLDSRDFVNTAKDRSYEVATFDALNREAEANVDEVAWSFINPFAGGKLFYGTPATVRIAKSEEREVQLRREETLQAIERQAAQVATIHNSAIESFTIADAAYEASKHQFDVLTNHFLVGAAGGDDVVVLQQISDVEKQMLIFLGQRHSSIMDYMLSESLRQRLLLENNYGGLMPSHPAPVQAVIL